MKKVLSVFLAVLMIVTCFSTVLSFAADDDVYTITFVDDEGRVIATRTVTYYGTVKAPENPTKLSTEEYEYVFKGWSDGESDVLYHATTIPNATKDVTYTAVFSEQKIPGNGQTVMTFIRSIFARINIIFEYFFRIFSRGGEAITK